MNEILERYYTENMVSNFLISKIPTQSPGLILDLGVGDASLIKAAYKKWELLPSYIGIDVDDNAIKQNKNLFPYCNFICLDALKLNFLKSISHLIHNVDVAICNPPYTIFNKEKRDSYNEIFELANLPSLKTVKNLSTEAIFLAYNLAVLKSGGILGIILPDGLLTNKSYLSLRNDLLLNHKVTHIVELPEKVFSKTEAKTHIVIIKKGKCSSLDYKVDVLNLDLVGQPSETLTIKNNLLNERMDYSYQKNKDLFSSGRSLKDLGIQIFRGAQSTATLTKKNEPFFHSTTFKSFESEKINIPFETDLKRRDIARVGDVLMTRVGKRSVGRMGVVYGGSMVVSDCIFIIRIPYELRTLFYQYIKSPTFKKSIELLKHGVCSQVISKIDLENLKVDFTHLMNQENE